jgi:hypothetical protein
MKMEVDEKTTVWTYTWSDSDHINYEHFFSETGALSSLRRRYPQILIQKDEQDRVIYEKYPERDRPVYRGRLYAQTLGQIVSFSGV